MAVSTTQIFGWNIPALLTGAAVYAVWIVVTWSLKKALFSWLDTLSKKTETEIDDLIIDSINSPLNLMLFVWGANVAVRIIAPTPAPHWVGIIATISKMMSIAAGIMF